MMRPERVFEEGRLLRLRWLEPLAGNVLVQNDDAQG